MLVSRGLRIADRRVGHGPLGRRFRRGRTATLVQSGALAVGLLAGVRRRGFCPSIRASVGAAIGTRVRTSLSPAIGTRVRTTIGTGVVPVFGTAFGTTIGAVIRTTLRTSIGTVLRTVVRTTFGTTIRTALGTTIGTEIRTTLGTAIRTTLRTTVRPEIRTTFGTAVGAGVGATIGTSVRPIVGALSARILSLRGAGVTTIAVRCAITASGCIHLIPVNSLDRTPRARVSRDARSFPFSQIVGPTRDSQRCHRSHRRPEAGVRRAEDPAATPARAAPGTNPS